VVDRDEIVALVALRGQATPLDLAADLGLMTTRDKIAIGGTLARLVADGRLAVGDAWQGQKTYEVPA